MPATTQPLRRRVREPSGAALALGLAATLAACGSGAPPPAPEPDRAWRAGDHHIHSRYSVGWDRSEDPPAPVIGADGIYPIAMNALMARHHGLDWMVATDHGGPNHSKVNLEVAYPELLQSRMVVPDVIQFWGMEFDTPGADHSSLIVPHTHDEAERLRELESAFAKREAFPVDSTRDTEPKMLEALTHMRSLPAEPVLIANHPSRSAPGLGEYGLDTPSELRGWNDTAPDVAVGMAGAPGHQAIALDRTGAATRPRPRSGYANYPTLGGFDQMTARLGGFWDSMLGEGRRWWITANSDSHRNWREGGADFWPGEYAKTYVLARKSHDDILDGIRNGRVFVTTGDLISELEVSATVTTTPAGAAASIGGTLAVPHGSDVRVTVRFLDPEGVNHRGEAPEVTRVDLIGGEVSGPVADPNADTNASTRVLERFHRGSWTRHGEHWQMSYTLENVTTDRYLRVRGTNTDQLEPEPDPPGEDPWRDLWFYSNPVFLEVGR